MAAFGAERHERSAADQLPHGLVRAEVAPAENRRQQAQPVWVAASKLARDGDRLGLGEKVLLRHVSLASDLDLKRTMCAQIFIHSVFGPQAEHTTASRVSGS